MLLDCHGLAVLGSVLNPFLAVLNIRFAPVLGAMIDPSLISERTLQFQACVLEAKPKQHV
jgi:hypothetical protein